MKKESVQGRKADPNSIHSPPPTSDSLARIFDLDEDVESRYALVSLSKMWSDNLVLVGRVLESNVGADGARSRDSAPAESRSNSRARSGERLWEESEREREESVDFPPKERKMPGVVCSTVRFVPAR